MAMPGRSYSATNSYRYGFNGQERDNEIGENNYGAFYWEYDGRTGHRWNIDPVRKEGLSPYAVNALNPVWFMDPLGNDWYSNDQGMFIWSEEPSIMMAGFRNYHGTELPEGVSRSQILTKVAGQYGFFYKYKSDGIAKFVNWADRLFGGKGSNVTLKQYSWHDVALSNELRDYALLGALGKIVGPVAKLAKGILTKAGGSLWKIAAIAERGLAFEAAEGANLMHIKNYPVIDKFLQGVGTSIKTLDFNTPSYVKNPKAILSTLKKYINNLANFEGANVGGVNTIGQIQKKVLTVGVPKGASEEQIQLFKQAVEYGKSLNVEVQIKAVR